MQTNVMVSVLIPVYNAEPFLEECLISVLNQTLQEIEVICVDDGSTDNSYETLLSYQEKDSRICILHQENKGAGQARNNAINNATGKYIAFMDPDDWYPDMDILETLYKKAVKNKVNICGGSFSEFKNGEINTTYLGDYKKYTFHKEEIISFREYQFDYGYTRFIYNLEFLKKNQIFFPDYRRFQDPPFLVKAMICSEVFYAVPKITYCYRKGHNKVQWNSLRTNGLVRGLIDNLKLSRDSRLSLLHLNTVNRLNKEYMKPIIKNVTLDNLELMVLLLEANEQIDINLLKEADPHFSYEKKFILESIKYCLLNDKDVLKIDAHLQLDAIKHSWSYKIGLMVTIIPRKIITIIKILKVEGFRGVMRVIRNKIS